MGLWVVGLAVAVALIFGLLGSAITTDDYFTNNPESDRAEDLLEARGFDLGPASTEIVIVRSETLTVDQPEYRSFVESLFSDLKGLGDKVISGGTHYYQTGAESLVSQDRNTTIIPFDHADEIERVYEVVDRADATGGFQVFVTGTETFDKDFIEISQEDLGVEFMIGIPAAIVIVVLVFGTLLAAPIPVILALVSIVMAVAMSAVIGQAFELSVFVTNVIAMIGLAVGVDYSLFIVARYREERRRGLDNGIDGDPRRFFQRGDRCGCAAGYVDHSL